MDKLLPSINSETLILLSSKQIYKYTRRENIYLIFDLSFVLENHVNERKIDKEDQIINFSHFTSTSIHTRQNLIIKYF